MQAVIAMGVAIFSLFAGGTLFTRTGGLAGYMIGVIRRKPVNKSFGVKEPQARHRRKPFCCKRTQPLIQELWWIQTCDADAEAGIRTKANMPPLTFGGDIVSQ